MRLDPLEIDELLHVRLQIDVLFGAVVVAEEVGLGLAAILPFLEMAVREFVTIVRSAGDDSVEIRADSSLFCDFPVERSDEILAFVYASLGKLPASTMVFPLKDEDLAVLRLTKNHSDVWAVRSHLTEMGVKQGTEEDLQHVAMCEE